MPNSYICRLIDNPVGDQVLLHPLVDIRLRAETRLVCELIDGHCLVGVPGQIRMVDHDGQSGTYLVEVDLSFGRVDEELGKLIAGF